MTSKQYFETFANGFKNVAKDWEGMTCTFADSAKLKYVFEGFPVIEGDEATCNAGFKKAIGNFCVNFTYLHGSETDCIYSFEAYYETGGGEGALYSGHGFLEFDDDGKVAKKVAYSNDSKELAQVVLAFLSQQEQ